MENVLLENKQKNIHGTLKLTGSKSESNRALIMQALCNEPFHIAGLSAASDTKSLQKLLCQPKKKGVTIYDVGPAGSAMRFLAAYLAITPGEHLLTGSARMQERPIKILVDALKSLGANIEYTNKKGYPPLLIKGKTLNASACLQIDGSVSSQYISALLLIAPTLPQGLSIQITGKISSWPYIEMTLKQMQMLGIQHVQDGERIAIKPQTYKAQTYKAQTLYIAPDWSAASYWYSVAALAHAANILLQGFTPESLQGDQVITAMMRKFGVFTAFETDGIRLTKQAGNTITFAAQEQVCFSDCPDLAQTMIAMIAGLGLSGKFTGLESLKIKETDRVLALRTELSKFGYLLLEDAGVYTLEKQQNAGTCLETIIINTYDDHRMAMSFAPLVLKTGKLKVENPAVVSKSYPDFWKDLATLQVVSESSVLL